jgi:hypothetical protein
MLDPDDGDQIFFVRALTTEMRRKEGTFCFKAGMSVGCSFSALQRCSVAGWHCLLAVCVRSFLLCVDMSNVLIWRARGFSSVWTEMRTCTHAHSLTRTHTFACACGQLQTTRWTVTGGWARSSRGATSASPREQ